MTVIDLGELRDVHHPEPPVRPRRPARRVPMFAAVLLVVLVTLVASSPLPVRDVIVVPFRLGGDRFVAGDLLLVMDPSDRLGGPRSVTAYRLPHAEQVWQTTLPVEGLYWGAFVRGGLLLVTGYDPESHDDETVAVDVRTGAYRWQQPGQAVPVAGNGLLLEVLGEDGSGTVRAVDLCCGTPRWQVSVPPGGPAYQATGWEVDRMATITTRGRAEVRDTGTGRVLAAADLPVPDLPVPDRQFGPAAQVVGDLLVTADGGLMTAYGLDRLDRRWQVPMPDGAYATACGGVICTFSTPGVVAALDAATGRTLWTHEGWDPMWAEGRHLMVVRMENSDNRLRDLVLVDPASGRVRAELGRWDLVDRWGAEGPLLAVRPRTQPPGGLVVAELDVNAATARILDVLPEAAGECQSADGGLLCRRRDGSLGLWLLPR